MKKILILALVAIVAGAAFAETDPVFSGSFSTYWAYSFAGETLSDSNDIDMSIDLGATIDEFNTVDVTVSLEDALYWDDVNDDDVFDGIGEVDNQGRYLRMDSFTLSTDLTGALGVDAPVSVMTKMGDFEFGSVNVGNVAPLYWDELQGSGADGGIGIAFTIGVMDMVTLGTVVYPVNAFEDELGEAGITIQASDIAGMIDFAAYFIASEYDRTIALDGDPEDDEGMNMGASVAVSPVDGVDVGLTFNYDMYGYNSDLEAGVAGVKLDVAYSGVENLTTGLSFVTMDFTEFMGSSALLASAEYALMDNLSVYGGVGVSFISSIDGIDFEMSRDVTYDVGLTTALAALDITVGVSDNLDMKAPEDDFDDTLYINFSTSF